jgi:LAGLIDADG DNA endonuclease family protein
MLGHPSIPRYHRVVRRDVYDGDNVTGADNQQERLGSAESEAANWFLAGFIEGEGALCVSVKKHPTCRSGFYVDPDFFLYQHESGRRLLELAQSTFEVVRSIRNRETQKSWSTRSRPPRFFVRRSSLSSSGTSYRLAARRRPSSGSAKFSRR